jgi:cell division protein FtsB
VSARATATSPAVPKGQGKSTSTSVRLSGRAAILLFAVFMLAMVSIAPTRVWLDQRARLRELEHQATELEAANTRLEERVADLRDPDTLERLARECLGMVEPGEIAIITVPRNGAPAPPAC